MRKEEEIIKTHSNSHAFVYKAVTPRCREVEKITFCLRATHRALCSFEIACKLKATHAPEKCIRWGEKVPLFAAFTDTVVGGVVVMRVSS